MNFKRHRVALAKTAIVSVLLMPASTIAADDGSPTGGHGHSHNHGAPPTPPGDDKGATKPSGDDKGATRPSGEVTPPAKPGDPLRDAGVSADSRRAAIAASAKTSGRDELHELLAVIEACGACGAAPDLASLLAAWDPVVLATPAVMTELIGIAASDRPEAVRLAAARAINAVPESKRPPEAAPYAARRVEIVCLPGQMKWDPKEFSVPAGVVLELVMRNDDTMQHNLLVIAPGSLSEIGVAADRMGETLEAKARGYVPDSPKVLHVMGMADPGTTKSLWLWTPTKPATYPLVCTYPGHWRMMNAKMKVTKPGSA